MSRSQQTETFDTAKGQNAGYYANSQNSYNQAQGDVGDYQDQLAKYSASNPYKQGGEYQTSTNQILANTSDAAARGAGNTLQSQALRTGQNSAGAVAATEAMQQQNTRNLSGEEAQANQERIGQEAGYNKSALTAAEVPAQLEAGLSGQQGNLGEGTLGVQQKAGDTPSWMDEFGGALAKSLGSGGGVSFSSTGGA